MPDSTVPVTTVPAPCRVKDRSTASRNRPDASRPANSAASSASLSPSSAMPSPVTAETGRMSAPASAVPAKAARISAATSARRSGVGQVGLGQGDHAARDAEQVDDRQMLAGLRHHPVIGGDHQQHEVDAGGAGQHGVHQPLMARARR